MKFTDIIELAKQGYKPSDVKELIELSKLSESEEVEQKTEDHDIPKVETEDKEKEENSDSEKDEQEDSVDYKKLYEQEKEKTEKLQKAFTKTDISGEVTPDDFQTVLSAVKEFM